jgi:hypothetical protein
MCINYVDVENSNVSKQQQILTLFLYDRQLVTLE